jgi:ATP-dependent DNA helicase RecG
MEPSDVPAGEWIDVELSQQLPLLRDRGEGQNLEFMERYPENGFELSKEVAAFASSNAGTILLGVSDDGRLVGLSGMDDPAKRDHLCRRIEGVCAGNLRPAITPVMKFAREESAVVLAIEVPRGRQPIYYSKHTPYIRHLSQSRPAEPHEVIERIEDWLRTSRIAQLQAEETGTPPFIAELGDVLADVLTYSAEFERRNVNPWLDLARAQFRTLAQMLRELASRDEAIKENLVEELHDLANVLDKAAAHRLAIGRDSWNTLIEYVRTSHDRAAQMKSQKVDAWPLSSEMQRGIYEQLRKSSRELDSLTQRADQMANDGRLDDVLSQAADIGYVLSRLGYLRVHDVSADFSAEIVSIGQDLHLLKTERIYMDGGLSIRRVLDKLRSLSDRLSSAASALTDPSATGVVLA